MIFGQDSWSQIPYAVRHWTWTNIPAFSALHVYPLRKAATWRSTLIRSISLFFGADNFVSFRSDSFPASRLLLFLAHVAHNSSAFLDWFDVLDDQNLPLLTEREVRKILQAIINDADTTDPLDVARGAVGVLSTENRKIWSSLRTMLSEDKHNKSCLSVVDQALFVVCLDDTTPENLADVCNNYLCGTYKLQNGEQIGTCVNRWYDKLQIIVCADGSAGINFEHTGVDGHTVLRFAIALFAFFPPLSYET